MKIIDRRDIPVPSSETAGLENPAYRGMGNPVNGYQDASQIFHLTHVIFEKEVSHAQGKPQNPRLSIRVFIKRFDASL